MSWLWSQTMRVNSPLYRFTSLVNLAQFLQVSVSDSSRIWWGQQHVPCDTKGSINVSYHDLWLFWLYIHSACAKNCCLTVSSFQPTMDSRTGLKAQRKELSVGLLFPTKGGSGVCYCTRLYENQTHLRGVNQKQHPPTCNLCMKVGVIQQCWRWSTRNPSTPSIWKNIRIMKFNQETNFKIKWQKSIVSL